MNIPHFSSFVHAGFECTYALTKSGQRLDMLEVTKHDVYCREDYERIKTLGIKTAREGLSWHQIDRGNGVYDFSRFEKMMQIGKEEGVQQIWDLNHFDYPERLDPFSETFVTQFATYAKRAHEVIRRYQNGTLYVVPINEISYFTWIAADQGQWAPFCKERGDDFKRQLVRAAIAAMDTIWEEDPDVHFLHVDPFLYRRARDRHDAGALAVEKDFGERRFEAWDMLAGRVAPEIGGDPKYLDLIGVNYYYANQEWIVADAEHPGAYKPWSMRWYSKARRSFAELLEAIYDRYHRPLVVTETGSYGSLRARWWKRTLEEINEAKKTLPLLGMCVYPVIDYPDWVGLHLTNAGLWDRVAGDPKCVRIPHHPSIRALSPYIRLWDNPS